MARYVFLAHRIPVAGALALALTVVPTVAAAYEIEGGVTLKEETEYADLIVRAGGSASVAPFDGRKGGRLHIRATRIVVEEGGEIPTVGGKGHVFAEMSDGLGPGGGFFGGPGEPGGGAGAFGPGGQGTQGTGASCTVFGGLGGLAYMAAEAPTSTTDLGSSGAAANVNSLVTAGGRGGGILILEANTIELYGTIDARGHDGTFRIGAGGGGGGIIHLRAHTFEFGAMGQISVRGGNGSASSDINGGGGAGGVIVFEAPDETFTAFDVAGGRSGSCDGTGAGSDGQVLLVSAPTDCFDLDNDEFTACDTPVADCNDIDATINPGELDKCDGIDNECSGKADDKPDELCEGGAECVVVPETTFSKCEGTASGTGSGSGADPGPELVYIGGCHVGERGGVAPACVATALLALAARRRRGPRRRRA